MYFLNILKLSYLFLRQPHKTRARISRQSRIGNLIRIKVHFRGKYLKRVFKMLTISSSNDYDRTAAIVKIIIKYTVLVYS